MNDHELLQRFIESGDQDAFAELVRRHIGLVRGIARRQACAHADDITQTVFWLLARRSRQAMGRPVLAGWLFRVTWNCCANARRGDRRREIHERKAGELMNKQHHPEPRKIQEEHEEMMRQLDVALAALPRNYRDAVLLRYLQGRSVEETAISLGLSPTAAGKRATRGLEKLRARFSGAGYAVGTGAIAAMLAAESAKGAPAVVVQTIAANATVPGGLGAAKAAILGHGATRAIDLAWPKIGAAILSMAAMVGIIVLAVNHWGSQPQPPQHPGKIALIAFPGPAAADVQPAVDETKFAGDVCFAQVAMLIDGAGADALRKATQAIDAKSDLYELRQGDSPAVRAAIKQVQSQGQIIRMDDPRQSAMRPREVFESVRELFDGFTPIARNNRALAASFFFTQNTSTVVTTDGQAAHFQLDIKGAQGSLRSAPLAADGSLRPGINGADPGPGVDKIDKPAAVKWTGAIDPGRMLVVFEDFGAINGDHIVSVHIVEVYKATRYETRYMNKLGLTTWIEGGPAELRKTADRAIVWAAGGDPTAPGQNDPKNDRWTKRLSDGTTVQLLSVSAPQDLPLCRWNPDGQPLVLPENEAMARTPGAGPRGGGQPPALTVALQIRPHTLTPDTRADPYNNVRSVVPQDSARVSLFVGAGDWKVQPLAENESVQIGNASISLSGVVKIPSEPAQSVNLMADGQPSPDTELHLGVVTKDHRQIMCHNGLGEWPGVWVRASVGSGGIIDVAQDQIDHYIVFSRPREEVVFEGFKTVPADANLPASVTDAEVRTAENKLEQIEWNSYWAGLSAELARVEAIPRDAATPVGAVRIMMDKANAGDVKGLRQFITGDDPRATEYAQAMIAYGQAINATMKKFGAEETYRAAFADGLWPNTSFRQLVAGNWSISGDTASNNNMAEFLGTMVQQDGKWCYKLYAAGSTDDIAPIKTFSDAYIKDLEAGKFEDAKDAMQHLTRWAFLAPFMLN